MSNNLENRYLSIDNANTENVSFDIPLPPFVDRMSIGVDIHRLQSMLRMGGIKHLKVIGRENDDESSETPEIVGFDAQGNAYAAKKSTKIKRPEFNSFSEIDNSNGVSIPHSFIWKNTTVSLNLREINTKIRQEQKWEKGLYTPAAWAEHFDVALRSGIAKEGTKHLVFGLNRRNVVDMAFINVLMSTSLSSSIQAGEAPMTAIFLYGMEHAISYYKGRHNRSDFRFSLFHGSQLDRAVLLKVQSLRKGLIAAI